MDERRKREAAGGVGWRRRREGGEEEVSRAEAAFSIKMPTSPHCSSRRRRRRRRRARYVHNVAGPREPHAAAFIRFPVFIAPRPFLPTCTLLPSTDPISVPTVTVFSLLFFFSILLPPSNIAHVGAEGELRSLVSFHRRCSWAPGRVPGRDSKFSCLFALPFCICSFYFISFFFFLFLWALFFGFNEEEREKGVF